MILFVFEGEKREPRLYNTLERLFLRGKEERVVCSFGNNIYELYNTLQKLDSGGDIVSVMRERLHKKGKTDLDGIKSSDIAETFLFFDYDFQNSQLSVPEMNSQVAEMLAVFKDETENGKLYINYPMVESIRYVKELPDDNYVKYIVKREDCRDFKRIASNFSHYNNLDFILLDDDRKQDKPKCQKVYENWRHLINMNVSKANFIINGNCSIPADKQDIEQKILFMAQQERFVEKSGCVAILNSFPIFLYEYLKVY